MVAPCHLATMDWLGHVLSIGRAMSKCTPCSPPCQAAAREYGEESCRAFRTSVLEALPHSWQGSWDTALHLAHFQRQKRGKGEQKADLARLAREDGGAGSSPAQRTGLKLGGSPPNALAGVSWAGSGELARVAQEPLCQPSCFVSSVWRASRSKHLWNTERCALPRPPLQLLRGRKAGEEVSPNVLVAHLSE